MELNTLRVTFEGKILPNLIKYSNCILPVKVFTSKILFCSNCLKYNHSEKYCCNKAKCAKCGAAHNTSTCDTQLTDQYKCMYCSDNHLTGDADCTVF